MSKTREWLLYNSVLTWLHHYSSKETELTPQYKQLEKELQFEYEGKLNEQPTNIKTRARGRPAKRKRTQKATGNTSSQTKNPTTTKET